MAKSNIKQNLIHAQKHTPFSCIKYNENSIHKKTHSVQHTSLHMNSSILKIREKNFSKKKKIKLPKKEKWSEFEVLFSAKTYVRVY